MIIRELNTDYTVKNTDDGKLFNCISSLLLTVTNVVPLFTIYVTVDPLVIGSVYINSWELKAGDSVFIINTTEGLKIKDFSKTKASAIPLGSLDVSNISLNKFIESDSNSLFFDNTIHNNSPANNNVNQPINIPLSLFGITIPEYLGASISGTVITLAVRQYNSSVIKNPTQYIAFNTNTNTFSVGSTVSENTFISKSSVANCFYLNDHYTIGGTAKISGNTYVYNWIKKNGTLINNLWFPVAYPVYFKRNNLLYLMAGYEYPGDLNNRFVVYNMDTNTTASIITITPEEIEGFYMFDIGDAQYMYGIKNDSILVTDINTWNCATYNINTTLNINIPVVPSNELYRTENAYLNNKLYCFRDNQLIIINKGDL